MLESEKAKNTRLELCRKKGKQICTRLELLREKGKKARRIRVRQDRANFFESQRVNLLFSISETSLIALSDATFSLGHILIVSAFGTAIAIIHGDREAIAVDDRDGVCRCASKRLVRRLLRREIVPCYLTHYTEAFSGPPEAIYGQGFNKG